MPRLIVGTVRTDRKNNPRQREGSLRTTRNPYGRCCCPMIHRGRGASHALQATADTLRGVNICADSKLYSVAQLCLQAWLWRRPPRRKSSSVSASAFNRSAPTAITTTRPTPARRWASTGQDTFTTASSSAWAHGPAGATVTAGAAIASPMVGADDITVVAVLRPIVRMPMADLVPRRRVPAQLTRIARTPRIPRRARVPAHRMPLLTPQPRVPALLMRLPAPQPSVPAHLVAAATPTRVRNG
jgi:hypothetical protein